MEKNSIRDTYIQFNLEHGREPHSVFELTKLLNESEEEFYKHYASLKAVEKDVWLSKFQETLAQLHNDSVYAGYSSREKLLAFYFMWIQNLLKIRSFILLRRKNFSFSNLKAEDLSTLRDAFYTYANGLLRDGEAANEVKERKYISDKYAHGFWFQMIFVLNYWIDDESPAFESTDAAIEKAVNLSFKLVSENTLDSLLDFGKFVFQSKR
jgi:Tetracyclin repressor-like, C-terminal domain